MILGGFLMLPATYAKVDTLRVNQTAIGIFGLAILTAGFSFSALLTFTIRNPLFQAEAIHQPCALASIVGLLTVFYNFITSSSYTWKTPTLLLAIAAGLSTLIYASLFLLSHRRISKIRSRPQPSSGSSVHPLTLTSPSRTSFASPATPYEPSTLEPTESRRPSAYQPPGFYENYIRNMYPTSAHSNTNTTNNNNATGAPSSSTGDVSYDPHSISEEEMQRQQMLMLLLANENPTQQQRQNQQQTTFHIDWQGQDGDGDETPAHGYYAPGVGTNASSSSDGGVGTGGSWPTPPPPQPLQPQPSPGRRWKGALKPWDGVWRGVARRGEGERMRQNEQQQQQQQQQQQFEQQQFEQQQQQQQQQQHRLHQHQLQHQRSAEGREERRREIELGYR